MAPTVSFSPAGRVAEAGVGRIEIDADAEQIGAHQADDERVEPQSHPAQACPRIVLVEDARGPLASRRAA